MNRNLFRSVEDVPLEHIIVSRANTRTFYDSEALKGLTSSVGTVGQVYPVVLHRIHDDKFELIIGTRRLRAQQKIKAKTIPAFVLENIDSKELIILALAEQLHRQDLTPFEEARGFLQLCKDHGMTPKQVAERVGKPQEFIVGRLKILNLPEPVQDMLCKEEGIAFAHVDILASLKKPRDQIRYAKLVAKQRLSHQDLATMLQEEAGNQLKERKALGHRLFTDKSIALKVKRFNRFLERRVKSQLAIGGDDTKEIRVALRQTRRTIKGLLGHPKLKQGV